MIFLSIFILFLTLSSCNKPSEPVTEFKTERNYMCPEPSIYFEGQDTVFAGSIFYKDSIIRVENTSVADFNKKVFHSTRNLEGYICISRMIHIQQNTMQNKESFMANFPVVDLWAQQDCVPIFGDSCYFWRQYIEACLHAETPEAFKEYVLLAKQNVLVPL